MQPDPSIERTSSSVLSALPATAHLKRLAPPGGPMLLLKSLVSWVLILCLAVANGALREAVLVPSLGAASGLVLSGVLLCVCVGLVAYVLVRIEHGIMVKQSVFVGVLWLCLTLDFEFTFGRYIQHKSWPELLAAYTFKGGNLWPVVLFVTLVAPYLATLVHASLDRSPTSHQRRPNR